MSTCSQISIPYDPSVSAPTLRRPSEIFLKRKKVTKTAQNLDSFNTL